MVYNKTRTEYLWYSILVGKIVRKTWFFTNAEQKSSISVSVFYLLLGLAGVSYAIFIRIGLIWIGNIDAVVTHIAFAV